MTMRLYDTARREVVPFEPGRVVTMYTCGITPYDAAHLGHAAAYLTYDVLQRRLRDLGHETRCVRNVTDVDDDILRKARELGVHYLDLAAPRSRPLRRDMAALNLLPSYSEPRATVGDPRHPRLHRHGARPGHAYQAGGAVYFDVSTFPRSARSATLRPRRDARARRRARRQRRRPPQARPARLRALAAVARRTSRPGSRCGARAGPAGTSSARRSRCASSAPPSTCTAAGRDLDLPAPRVRGRPVRGGDRASPSCATGCTSAWSAWTARRCRSPWATCLRRRPAGTRHEPARSSASPSLAHHYRAGLEWDDGLLDEASARLAAWRTRRHRRSAALDEVRAALDDDLDTPGASSAIDAAAHAGVRRLSGGRPRSVWRCELPKSPWADPLGCRCSRNDQLPLRRSGAVSAEPRTRGQQAGEDQRHPARWFDPRAVPGSTAADLAASIGKRLAADAVAAEVNGVLADLGTVLPRRRRRARSSPRRATRAAPSCATRPRT